MINKKPDDRWLRLARKSGYTIRTGPKELLELKRALLDIGGWAVCVPKKEEDLKKIMIRGRSFPGRSTLMKGEPCQCHLNSACCWDENRDRCKICTGYALSKDGMWRQHSWVFTNQGRVVETTEKRVQYYGFVMTELECEEFLFANL